MSKHSKKRHKALAEYTRKIADEMGLRDWHLEVQRDHPDPGQFGQTTVWHNCTRAEVRLADHGQDKEELRDTVVHELLHCHLDGVWTLVEDTFSEHVAPDRWSTFAHAWARLAERTIDTLARSVSKQYPLP